MNVRGVFQSIANAFTTTKKPTQQERLDAYYRKHHTYEGFKLEKGYEIVNGCICQKKDITTAKPQGNKPAGSGPSIMTPEGQKAYKPKTE